MLCVLLRHVRVGEVRSEDFLYELKAGPAGGRLLRAAGSTSTGSGASLTLATEPPPL
jgi:hypothetical protein